MKKMAWMVAMVAAWMMVLAGMASAHISDEEITFGDVEPGVSMEYVESIYGTATTVKHLSPYATNYIYGDSLIFNVSEMSGNVNEIDVDADNGFKTRSGFHVGSSMKDVEARYGKQDFGYSYRPNGTGLFKQYKMIYRHYYTSLDANGRLKRWMSFDTVNENGKVVSIRAGMGDPIGDD